MTIISSPADLIGVKKPEIISFGSGQPDLPPPKSVFEKLDPQKSFRYGLIKGEEWLRKPLAETFRTHYNEVDKESLVITNGASEALDLVFRHLNKSKNKNLLIHAPYYYSYPHLATFAGLKAHYTQTINGLFDLDDLEEQIPKVNAFLINSPSNPTGCVQSVKVLKAVEKLCQDHNTTIISDEVYKDLIYDRENYFLSGDHVVTINSFSKTFSLCGHRIGYLYSNDPKIVNGVCEIKTHTSMNTSLASQEIALRALQVPQSYAEKQRKIFFLRRERIVEGLRELGIAVKKPSGAFYVLPEFQDPQKHMTELFNKYDLITYNGEWFGAPNTLRFSYALSLDQIDEGLRRLKKYLSTL